MFEEFEPASDEEEDGSSPGDSVATTADSLDHHCFLLGYSSSKVELRDFHPLPSQIPFYWETYKENVDPLCKVWLVSSLNWISLMCFSSCTYQLCRRL
jgi:hypothetical protein